MIFTASLSKMGAKNAPAQSKPGLKTIRYYYRVQFFKKLPGPDKPGSSRMNISMEKTIMLVD